MTEPAAPVPDALARRVLFLCVHNSSRSQMAEGFARAKAPAGSEIWSAGTRPTRLHPLALQVMREIDIDLSTQRAKTLDEVPWREVDTVVTLCAEGDDECPVLPGSVRRIHWPLPDPSAAPEERRLEVFRMVRDEIRWRVASLWPRDD
jgi:thioredoxin type arsenate reductase